LSRFPPADGIVRPLFIGDSPIIRAAAGSLLVPSAVSRATGGEDVEVGRARLHKICQLTGKINWTFSSRSRRVSSAV
jgi:hypothetical protein